MIIFHGSDTAVIKPKILSSNRLLDFGEGFYTTSSHDQAVRWAGRVSERRKSNNQIISMYDFNLDKAAEELQIIHFNALTLLWLHFVTSCRSGKETGLNYDIAMGPVANDNVYATIQLFETGLLSEDETITRLKIEKIYNQILFHTEESLNYFSYIKHEKMGEAKNE